MSEQAELTSSPSQLPSKSYGSRLLTADREVVAALAVRLGMSVLAGAAITSGFFPAPGPETIKKINNNFGINSRNVTPLKCGSGFSIPPGVTSNFRNWLMPLATAAGATNFAAMPQNVAPVGCMARYMPSNFKK